MFHNQTRIQGDKQHYYEFNATGMGHFEIKLVSRIISNLKIEI
jgi:hypothetical protein